MIHSSLVQKVIITSVSSFAKSAWSIIPYLSLYGVLFVSGSFYILDGTFCPQRGTCSLRLCLQYPEDNKKTYSEAIHQKFEHIANYCSTVSDIFSKELICNSTNVETNFLNFKKHLKVQVKWWNVTVFAQFLWFLKIYFLEIPWEIAINVISGSLFRKCKNVLWY